MEATLNFILKSGIGLLALYLFYYALLRNETNFRFNRLYLLLAPLVALSLPLIKWPALLSPDTAITQTLQAIQLSEVTVVAYRQQAAGLASLQLLTPAILIWGLYLLVALLLTFKLCRQLWHIRSLTAKATPIARTPDAVQVLQLEQHYSSFAFLNYVFLSNQEQLTPREKQQVLAHELAHVQLGHTYDILFYELLSIVLWFNPVIWFLKSELRNLHEYQADARVLEQHQLKEYRKLLSKEVLFNMGLPVGSHFQRPQVLHRLHMLKQHGKQPGWLKPLFTLPLLVVLVLTLTSQQVASDIVTTLSPDASQEKQLDPAPGMPVTTSSSPTDSDRQREQVRPARKNNELKESASEHNTVATTPTADEKPYTYVEQMPVFQGGETDMHRYLGMNIRYPKDAQEARQEGMVVISFVIEKDGQVHDVQVLKSVSESIDAEAVRVVKHMNGSWKPGMQNGKAVPVRYTLPVRFAIK